MYIHVYIYVCMQFINLKYIALQFISFVAHKPDRSFGNVRSPSRHQNPNDPELKALSWFTGCLWMFVGGEWTWISDHSWRDRMSEQEEFNHLVEFLLKHLHDGKMMETPRLVSFKPSKSYPSYLASTASGSRSKPCCWWWKWQKRTDILCCPAIHADGYLSDHGTCHIGIAGIHTMVPGGWRISIDIWLKMHHQSCLFTGFEYWLDRGGKTQGITQYVDHPIPVIGEYQHHKKNWF